jgi:hypothetical protein
MAERTEQQQRVYFAISTMEPTFQLTPESARALALRLFTKEQFQADPKGCIIRALDWLDAAASDSTSAESPRSATPARSALVERLDELVKTKGLETIAKAVGVSPGALRSWLRGVEPNAVNHQRIEAFLRASETSPTDAAGAEEAARRSGELFTEPAADPAGKR